MTFDDFRADFIQRRGQPPTALDSWTEAKTAERERCAKNMPAWLAAGRNDNRIDIIATVRAGKVVRRPWVDAGTGEPRVTPRPAPHKRPPPMAGEA